MLGSWNLYWESRSYSRTLKGLISHPFISLCFIEMCTRNEFFVRWNVLHFGHLYREPSWKWMSSMCVVTFLQTRLPLWKTFPQIVHIIPLSTCKQWLRKPSSAAARNKERGSPKLLFIFANNEPILVPNLPIYMLKGDTLIEALFLARYVRLACWTLGLWSIGGNGAL